MSQITKIVDVMKSFQVLDPNTFMENLGFTKQGDQPDEAPPIVAFEGYNFLPTAYGYRSYFGLNSTLSIPALPSKTDSVLSYQLANYRNIAIALCEDGIYVSSIVTAGAMTWIKLVTLTYTAGVYKEYTHALINNELYIYRAGAANVWKFTPTGYDGSGNATITTLTPSARLNMAGQMGIFRAANRLGFWDSANSISWSDHTVLTNFEVNPPDNSANFPSAADYQLYSAIIGRIVTILPQGDNFVVYATKSIVGCKFDAYGAILFDGQSISDLAGIAYSKQVTRGVTDLEHYAYTSIGLKKIGSYNAVSKAHAFETILPEFYDLLKESKDPIFLNLINGRFLTFSVVNPNYIDGVVTTEIDSIDAFNFALTVDGTPWDGISVAGMSEPLQFLGYAPWTNWSFTRWSPGFGLEYQAGASPTPADLIAARDSGTMPVVTAGSIATLATNPVTLPPSMLSNVANTAGAGAAPTASGGWSLSRTAVSPYMGITDGTQALNVAANEPEVVAYNNAALALFNSFNTVAPASDPAVVVASNVPRSDWDTRVWQTINGYDANNQIVTTSVIGSIPVDGYTTVTVPPVVELNASESKSYEFKNRSNVSRTVVKQASAVLVADSPATIQYSLVGTAVDQSTYGPVTPSFAGYSVVGDAKVLDADALLQAQTQLTNAYPATLTGTVGSLQGATGVRLAPVAGGVRYLWNGPFANNLNLPMATYTTSAPQAGQSYQISTVDTRSLSVSAPAIGSVHATAVIDSSQTVLTAGSVTAATTRPWSIPAIEIKNTPVAPASAVTLPGSTFLLQNGTLAPYYPTFYGAFFFDMSLKKWGKLKASHKTLVDYFPVNSAEGTISYSNFGMEAGLVTTTYTMKLFDSAPVDSKLKYGKFGFLRGGFTKVEELRIHFRGATVGNVELQSSLDGRFAEVNLKDTREVGGVAEFVEGYNQTGVWHTIAISGNFDLQYIELRARVAGKR